MLRRRRTEDEHDWAGSDAAWALGFAALLVLAGLNVFFLYLLLAFVAGGAVWLAVRTRRRRREARERADAPFWADRLMSPQSPIVENRDDGS